MSISFVSLVRSLPKTLLFNLRYFPLRTALKFSVIVSHNVLLKRTKGSLVLDFQHLKAGGIMIGFGETAIFDRKRSKTIWHVSGTIVFKGSAWIGHGSKIDVDGELVIGDKFKIQAESAIIVKKKIVFGTNCLISWDCQFMDTDFHVIKVSDEIVNPDWEIAIGNNCWFGSRCIVLKGSEIGNDVVVGAGTLLNRVIPGNNQLIGGSPARVLKSDISWSLK
jgi:serine acetyltransferase